MVPSERYAQALVTYQFSYLGKSEPEDDSPLPEEWLIYVKWLWLCFWLLIVANIEQEGAPRLRRGFLEHRICRPREEKENFPIWFLVALPEPAAKRTHASEGKVIKHLSRSNLGVRKIHAHGLRAHSSLWWRRLCACAAAGVWRCCFVHFKSENRERSPAGPQPPPTSSTAGNQMLKYVSRCGYCRVKPSQRPWEGFCQCVVMVICLENICKVKCFKHNWFRCCLQGLPLPLHHPLPFLWNQVLFEWLLAFQNKLWERWVEGEFRWGLIWWIDVVLCHRHLPLRSW